MADDDFVPLRRYADPMQAEMAADFLRDAGIPVVVSGQHSASILTRMMPVEIVVSVPKNQLESAREAMEALDSGKPSDPSPPGG